MMTRKQFLGRSVYGASLLAGGSLLNGCAGIKRMPGAFECLNGTINPQVAGILHLASLAPSGHNTQPWQVTLNKGGPSIISSVPDRWLPGVDPENRETMLSVGTFIENLTAAAALQGLRTEVEVTARRRSEREIAQFRFLQGKKGSVSENDIRMRRTVRSGYLSGELKRGDLQMISRTLGDNMVYFPFASPEGRYLSEGTVEANRVQAWRSEAQEELADWIRFSDREAKKMRNGLTPESMEINGLAGWVVRNFFDRSSVLTEDFRNKTVDKAAAQVKEGSGWLIVTSRDESVNTLVETGRLFERMFLQLREKNIAIHPMTQMLEEKPFRDEISSRLKTGERIQFLLRIGYVGKYRDPVSLRMPLERFVIAG